MAEVRVVFHIQDSNGNPIGGAILDAGVWKAATLATGDAETFLTPGHYDIRITAPGFNPSQLPADIQDPGTITRALERVALPSLEIRGRDFVDKSRQRIVLNGCDGFLAFRQYLDGVDLTPFFAESRDLGFNMWRVFFQGSKAQNGVLQLSPTEPGFYEHVRPFVQLLNIQGIVLLATIGVDNQDIRSRPEHWTRMYQLFDGTATIVSKANEWTKNLDGLNPGQLPNPTGSLLWSQGSDQQDIAPFQPTGPVMEFHPVQRFTTAMRDAVASPIELFEVRGYAAALLFDEPGRMGVVDPSPAEFAQPQRCYEYARIASTLCAGLVFHNRAGQSGRLMEEGTKACARAFVRGMTLT